MTAAADEGPAEAGTEGRQPHRVVLLGASNVARGISTIFETARLVCGEPIELLAAFGHGRSYGVDTRVLGRGLGGIVHCGLWKALRERPPRPTSALVTDIGNDLLYGQPVGQIAEWVEQCLERLAAAHAKTVMTELPVANVERLTPAKYEVARRFLFPSSRLNFEQVCQRALQLNEHVQQLAAKYDAVLIQQEPSWYSFDPIHLRPRVWPSVWREILGCWRAEETRVAATRSIRRWIFLRSLPPEHRTWFGRARYHAQPIARLRDGSSISYY